jgi:3-oxoadipate enol-lactonase
MENMEKDVVQTGRGRDLLLLHSLLADRSSFDRLLPELSSRYRVTLPNLPGYGTSAALTPPVTIAHYADWVAELIATRGLGANTAVLGNGLGGFIAVALAVRHGKSFGPLIVADALPGFPPVAKEPLRSLAARVNVEGMAGALDIAIRRMFPEDYIAAFPAVIDERKRALAMADPVAFQRACLALADLDLAPRLASIANRTLVIVGAEDRTTPPEIARNLAAGIPGARYAEIAGCGHCPQIQKPRELVALVDEFLA